MKAVRCAVTGAVLGIFAAAVFSAGGSAGLTEKQYSLSGIEAVSVFVQGVTKEAEKAGVSAAQIEAEVKGRLEKAGIKVAGEAEEVSGRPALYVNLSAPKRRQRAAFVYHVEVGLMQQVKLVRAEEIRIMSITWKKGSLGYCPAKSFAENVQRSLGDLMDAFVADRAAANGKL